MQRRGVPMAACENTFYTREPYHRDMVPVPPRVAVGGDEAKLTAEQEVARLTRQKLVASAALIKAMGGSWAT